MKRVTIQDIADELGVSRNTVSKAINNADGLAEATREKILQKAAEMGYKQFSYIQAQAVNHVEKETPHKGEIALLCGNIIAPAHFASLMLDKLKMELSQLGYSLITHRVERDNFAQRSLPVTFAPDTPVPDPPSPEPGSEAQTEAPVRTELPEDIRTAVPAWPVRRNIVKYPYFSEAYPARRLDLPGDPEAQAPIPGEKIWPLEGVPSLLQQILRGD
jgi:hypothetical protein